MKTIYLLRHAKSDWANADLNDYDRPLNKRGKNDAPEMGKKLKELYVIPELIISSPAKRTRQTIKKICEKINYPFNNIIFDESVYLSSLKNLITLVNAIDDNYKTVLLVGHNPGITMLNNYLTEDYIDNIPTCGFVEINMEIDHWNEIIQGVGIKKYFIYPRLYH